MNPGGTRPAPPREWTCRARTKPSISCSAAAFLLGLPRAFFAKGSVCPSAFLPGSAQYVENDVTPSKQTTATFLPGATTAPRGLRQGTAFGAERRGAAVPSLVRPADKSSIQSNYSFRAASPARAFARVLDPGVTNVNFGPFQTGFLGAFFATNSVRPRPFLTGSAPQTESSVTHSKQTIRPFLTGARTHIKEFRFRSSLGHSLAEKRTTNLATYKLKAALVLVAILSVSLALSPTLAARPIQPSPLFAPQSGAPSSTAQAPSSPAAAPQPSEKRVTAYTLPPETYKKARDLSRIHFRFAIISFFYGIFVLWLILQLRLAPKYRDWAEKFSSKHWPQALVFVPVVFLFLAFFFPHSLFSFFPPALSCGSHVPQIRAASAKRPRHHRQPGT